MNSETKKGEDTMDKIKKFLKNYMDAVIEFYESYFDNIYHA